LVECNRFQLVRGLRTCFNATSSLGSELKHSGNCDFRYIFKRNSSQLLTPLFIRLVHCHCPSQIAWLRSIIIRVRLQFFKHFKHISDIRRNGRCHFYFKWLWFQFIPPSLDPFKHEFNNLELQNINPFSQSNNLSKPTTSIIS